MAQRLGTRGAGEGEEGGAAPAPDDLDALLPETIKPRQVGAGAGWPGAGQGTALACPLRP